MLVADPGVSQNHLLSRFSPTPRIDDAGHGLLPLPADLASVAHLQATTRNSTSARHLFYFLNPLRLDSIKRMEKRYGCGTSSIPRLQAVLPKTRWTRLPGKPAGGSCELVRRRIALRSRVFLRQPNGKQGAGCLVPQSQRRGRTRPADSILFNWQSRSDLLVSIPSSIESSGDMTPTLDRVVGDIFWLTSWQRELF